VPSVAFAGLIIENVMGAIVDCEVECVDIDASRVGLSVVEGIGAGYGV